ncbi:MAG: hypothetical protein QOE50_745 [Sphingomonadales bacterium]|jgi:uncharacterized protein YjeT (DUF2065 family)|nr:hypothetical protein [Sphingomonadales bacterium]
MWIRSKAHLAEAGETYLDHLRFAAGVGLMLVAAGLACIIHGLLPGLCTKTASRTVDELKRLFAERDAFASALAESSGALVFVGLVALTLPSWALLLLAPGYPLPIATALFAMAIPAVYLWTNPQLEPVD